MKRVLIIIKFFSTYWAEIKQAAALTVELWTALVEFGRKLAQEMRDESDEQPGS